MRVFILILVLLPLLFSVSPLKAEPPDWSTLEVITEENIRRLMLLQSINLNDRKVKDTASFYDGEILYVAVVYGEDEQFSLLRVEPSGHQFQALKRYEIPVVDITFSPTGEWLGSVSFSDGVDLWRMPEGVYTTTIGGEIEFSTLAFHPQSSTLVTGWDDKIAEWDIDGGLIINTLLLPGFSLEDIAFSPTGDLLAVGKATGATVVDWQNWELLGIPVASSPNGQVLFSPDGNTIGFMSEIGQQVGLWDLSQEQQTLIKDYRLNEIAGNDILFNVNGQLFMIASSDGLEVYHGTTGRRMTTLTHFESEITTLSLSGDGRLLITGHVNGEVNVWGVPA